MIPLAQEAQNICFASSLFPEQFLASQVFHFLDVNSTVRYHLSIDFCVIRKSSIFSGQVFFTACFAYFNRFGGFVRCGRLKLFVVINLFIHCLALED